MLTTVSIILLFCLFNGVISYSQWRDDSSLDANYLIKLGEEYDNPMLEYYGHAFIMEKEAITDAIMSNELEVLEDLVFPANETFFNYVCKLRECKSWSKWSTCYGYPGTFSMIARTRRCAVNTSLCTYPAADERTEIDSRVCYNKRDDTCPHHYERIDGFCLRYVPYSGAKTLAFVNCRSDFAHIVNINTPAKLVAVDKLLSNHSYFGTIYINGHRSSTNDKHDYTYGGEPTFDNWAAGEPSDRTFELCKVLEDQPRRWNDRDCTSHYYTVCEKILES